MDALTGVKDLFPSTGSNWLLESAHPAIAALLARLQGWPSVQTSVEWINWSWLHLAFSSHLSMLLLLFSGPFPSHCACPWPGELILLTCCSPCLPQCWAYILSLFPFPWQPPLLEPSHTRGLSVHQARLAAVGIDGSEKHGLLSRTHSSPAASMLPHSTADCPRQSASTTGRHP